METTIEPIDRVAIQIGPIQIYWYAVIIISGVLIGLWLAMSESERRDLPKETFVDLVFFALPISIIAARLYYVIFQWEYYAENPIKIIAIWEGGLAMHGVLTGAVLTILVFAKVRDISFWKLTDILAPSLILGQAIGRWGNFINQEAHGGPVSREFLENLYLPDFIINQMYIEGTYYQPTFLYESLWNFGGFILLMSLRRANLRRGELFLTYIIYYSFGRFFIEGMRTDSLMLTDNLRMAQVISVVLIFVAMMIIWYRRKKGYADIRYLDNGM
ncbi:prolipoprotein diacylglyceryl transferase [Peribacillus cavernae]|uniref:Phosphatidylglycerol--prolipoprotein diacylglyceryl transferase n=1 Tax=Peribacillus cavernae TaxID=1674310 RepID=A0A3S0UCE1_9BACI|nr:prolipoprotein diacylglyceryl transferase [Peribacillus cavernae]MDQ0217847.1 phosphatidylglycerol:prolipoprotein diacylglycerol transferase [Peribacillus cavernae]RUQ28286.1 prolipoprotein diacylglyceryl transferase [Peribacillus cavernae]